MAGGLLVTSLLLGGGRAVRVEQLHHECHTDSPRHPSLASSKLRLVDSRADMIHLHGPRSGGRADEAPNIHHGGASSLHLHIRIEAARDCAVILVDQLNLRVDCVCCPGCDGCAAEAVVLNESVQAEDNAEYELRVAGLALQAIEVRVQPRSLEVSVQIGGEQELHIEVQHLQPVHHVDLVVGVQVA